MNKSFIAMVTVLGMSLVACGGVEDDCETICDWFDKCNVDLPDCVDECVDDMEDASDSCQDAFDGLAECVEEDDACDSSSSCGGEATEFLDDC